eukprot:282381_1
MESESILLSVESVLNQILDQKWIHPSVTSTDKLQALLACSTQLNTLLQHLSYESKYELFNGSTLQTNILFQILSKLQYEPEKCIQDIYWSIIDTLIINGADISVLLSTENGHKMPFGIYKHIQIVMKYMDKTITQILNKILHITNLWYECRLSLYDFNLCDYPCVVTFKNDTNMIYLSGVFSTMPSSDIIYELFCNGFQVFNVLQNKNNLMPKKKWSDLGLIFMVYLNYKQNMSKALRFEFENNLHILPFINICDIIDDYQFGSTSMLYSQIISDDEWIVYALKYIYSHSLKWKIFLKNNILLNENILKPKQFKMVQNAVARWDTHSFFWSKWLKEENNIDILKFYIQLYNGIWETYHIIPLLNKYINNLEMIQLILLNTRYYFDKVWFEKPLLLDINKNKKRKHKMNAKSTLLFDLLISRHIYNDGAVLKYIIHYLIHVKNGKFEHVSYQNAFYVHKMFISLYAMFCKQFREMNENAVIWNNMTYLLNELKKSGNGCFQSINMGTKGGDSEWNVKFDIDVGILQAFLACNITVVKYLINANIIDIERCLEMGYFNRMFKIVLQKNNRKQRNYRGNKMSERNVLRMSVLPLIIDSLLKYTNNNDKLHSCLLNWLQESRKSDNKECINILSSAVSAICVTSN